MAAERIIAPQRIAEVNFFICFILLSENHWFNSYTNSLTSIICIVNKNIIFIKVLKNVPEIHKINELIVNKMLYLKIIKLSSDFFLNMC